MSDDLGIFFCVIVLRGVVAVLLLLVNLEGLKYSDGNSTLNTVC